MNIVISGASRGIGYELVKILASDIENRVVAVSRNLNSLNALNAELLQRNDNIQLFPLEFDLADGDFNELGTRLSRIMRSVDLLINNAGLLINKPLTELSLADFDAMYKVNTRAVFLLSSLLLPAMPQGGQIINLSSMGGFQGSEKFPGLSLYSATKGAVAILTEAMAAEWSSKGITVNCLCPGAVDTEMLKSAFPGYKAPVTPIQMAQYIISFAQTAPGIMNGRIIPVTISNPK